MELEINASESDYNSLFNSEEKKVDEKGTKDVINNFVFIDIQGFRNRHRFICKEFCMISDSEKYHAIVKSPYNFEKLPIQYQRNANWLTKYFHGLSFECGNVFLRDVVKEIYPKLSGKKVLVKGGEKVEWLKNMFKGIGQIDCMNIEDLNNNITDENDIEYQICDYHNEKFGWRRMRWAMSSALKLKEMFSIKQTFS